jgi:hypothetical protein
MEVGLGVRLSKGPKRREKMNGVPKESEIKEHHAPCVARLLKKMAGIFVLGNHWSPFLSTAIDLVKRPVLLKNLFL